MSPLLSRIPKERRLAGKRGEIYTAICRSPGINFEAVKERVGMTGGGGPEYHLYVLEKLSYVQSFRVGRYRRYFAAGDQDYRRNRIRAMFTSPIYLETATAVSRRPGAIQREIADEFPAVSRQAVGYRLHNLEAAGAIARHPEGSHAIYYATMDGGYVLDHPPRRGPKAVHERGNEFGVLYGSDRERVAPVPHASAGSFEDRYLLDRERTVG